MENPTNPNPQQELLNKYKVYLNEIQNKDENYKWEAIDHFQKTWDIEAKDFHKMFLDAFKKQFNLFYQNSWGFMTKATKLFPDKTREMFRYLFDENYPINDRTEMFLDSSKELLPAIKEAVGRNNLNHQQDERTLSVYLSFRYPEKYYLYKNSFYSQYCALIGEDLKSAGEKYEHYILLAEDLKYNYVLKDEDILRLHKAINPNLKWDETNLIVQNIMYKMLYEENDKSEKHIEELLQKFSEIADAWFEDKPFIEARYHFFNEFKKRENLEKADWPYFQQLGDHINALVTNSLAKARALGKINNAKGSSQNPLENYRENFIDLIYGQDSIDNRIDRFNSNIPFFSDSSISELVGQFFPEDYVFFNQKDQEGIKVLGIDLKFKRGYTFGKKFQVFNEHIKPLMEKYEEIVGKRTNTTIAIETDQFLWFVSTQEEQNDAENKILDEISPTQKEQIQISESNETSYYWLNANPKFWSLDDLEQNPEIVYTTHTASGSKRRIYKYMRELKVGDKIIGYETSPIKKVKAILEVSKSIYTNEEDQEVFDMKLVEYTPTQPTWEALNKLTALKSAEVLNNNQGSLFKLTQSEFEAIKTLAFSKPVNEKYGADQVLADVFISPEKLDRTLGLLKRKKNIILQGPPGTGKTFFAKRLGYCLMNEKDNERVITVQFHQSYAYEDFIQGYRPLDGNLVLKNGIFYDFAKKASRDPDRDYVIIIDEINRGNLSKIFGELMLLLEADKRGEKVKLTYSLGDQELFTVPSNLYLIGTMNTADRSLALVDYALRRRFAFINMQPHFDDYFKDYLLEQGFEQEFIKDLTEKISAINAMIMGDSSLKEGFLIGHSYFVTNSLPLNPESWLDEVLNYEVFPLLEEYWFDNEDRLSEAKNILGLLN